ncbi:MAG TPA: hypothetical protein VK996_00195 [Ramlibacter sp.]|nr:hypothetical protein [Ramlibacter sp.]
MNQSIEPGLIPPPRGLEKEEPELAYEDDIPKDNDRPAAEEREGDERQIRQVGRE